LQFLKADDRTHLQIANNQTWKQCSEYTLPCMNRLAILALFLTMIGVAASPQSESPATAPATSQQEPAAVPAANPGNLVLTWSEIEKNIWQKAKPYIDLAPPEIEKQVPELDHVSWAASQDELPSILAGVGAQCVNLLKRTPNVIADERVETHSAQFVRHERYNYLVLVSHTQEGSTLKEYRSDPRGTPVPESAGSAAQGFASMWTRFFPGNQSESRFRYLGTQKLEKQEVAVVAFAQIPDKVKAPAEFAVGRRRISILFQGIAWIDPQSWRVLRLREDLLAPRPDAQLTRFTARAQYGQVKLKKAQAAMQVEMTLWLPQEADLSWTLGAREEKERHVYSNYRLYATKSKIVF